MGKQRGLGQPPAAGEPAALPQQPAGVPPPPPCWCGQALSDHATGAPDHDYAPAGGIESEAFDAW
jgi:hypothetical protein